MRFPFAVLTISVCLPVGGATVNFDPTTPDSFLFPSNVFTLADNSQKTGVRVNLGRSGCSPGAVPSEPTFCADSLFLNQLDGFNLNPRSRVCFSDPVRPDTLRIGVMFFALNGANLGEKVPINQVIYDPSKKCVFARPDQVLRQGSQYVLVVTNAVLDAQGQPLHRSDAFQACLQNSSTVTGCAQLAALRPALEAAAKGTLVGGTVFTTLSATDWAEKAHAQVQTMTPTTGVLGAFAASSLSTMEWSAQTSLSGVTNVSLPVDALRGVGKIAFGWYTSPNYISPALSIPATATNGPIAGPMPPVFPPGSPATPQVHYTGYLPKYLKPPAGYPVILFGHGLTGNRFIPSNAIASAANLAGFALLSPDVYNHGFGPAGTVALTTRTGGAVTLPAPGRAFPNPADGTFGPTGACVFPNSLGSRDCARQTAVDFMTLIKAIRTGLDVDGDGTNDLDGNRIYYLGQSFGSIYGTILAAIEPNIRAVTLNVGGGTAVDVVRHAFDNSLKLVYLGSQNPPLVPNAPPPVFFDDQLVARDLETVVARELATAYQEVFERADWLGITGDSLAYATHLRANPLPGRSRKPVLVQFVKGDREVPNPTNSALIRAAELRTSSRYLRVDRARPIAGSLPVNPHRFLTNVSNPAEIALAAGTQGMVLGFFASNGAIIPNVNLLLRLFFGADLFEVPATLPETTNYEKKSGTRDGGPDYSS